YDANNDAESMSEGGPERAADEDFSYVAQHVIAHTLRARSVNVAVDGLQSAECVHGKTEQRGEKTDLDHHPQNCGCGSFAHRWVRIGAARIELHHASGVGNGFDTGKREHYSDKTGPVLPEAAVQGL